MAGSGVQALLPPSAGCPQNPRKSATILSGASQGALEEWAPCPRPPTTPFSSWDSAAQRMSSRFSLPCRRPSPSTPHGPSPLGCAVPPHLLYRSSNPSPARSLCPLEELPQAQRGRGRRAAAVALQWCSGLRGHEGSASQPGGSRGVTGPHQRLISSDPCWWVSQFPKI